ncbi:PepSY domain-containing protein [Propylenella binzhouense]|uniref:Uncharacterized protein n=1 Tax=Propylenella binzhouense TaxID=2555902 RepID=A0A964T8C7_9HYPH|nr:hypothetical protein [Propylenella binzhouense]MYZ50398.1 hypothetical protein [Propylenella binzhouense]
MRVFRAVLIAAIAVLLATPATLAQPDPGRGRGGPPFLHGRPNAKIPPGQMKGRQFHPPAPAAPLAPFVAPAAPQPAPAPALPSGCLSQQQANGYVRGQQVISLSAALRRSGVPGQPVRAALCARGGTLVYEVGVLGPGGQLRTLTIPAN